MRTELLELSSKFKEFYPKVHKVLVNVTDDIFMITVEKSEKRALRNRNGQVTHGFKKKYESRRLDS